MNRVVEIWQDKFKNKIRLTWNPCNCHPKDLMKEYGPKLKKAVTYSNQNKISWTKKLLKNKMIRLSREVIKLK